MDAQEFAQLVSELPDEVIMPLLQRLEPQLFADMRGMTLADAKNYVTVRVLQAGTPVSTLTVAGTTADLLGHSVGDTLNFLTPAAVTINDDNRRQFDIRVGGGGADCMFDAITSTCFTSLTNWVEGTAFTSLSGCTFYGYSTIGAAFTKLIALGGDRSLYICHGSYSENVSVQNSSHSYTVIGAGVDCVTLTASSSASPTFNIGTGTNFSITGMTLVGNGANVVLNHVNGGLLDITGLVLKPQSGGTGFEFTGGEFVHAMRIQGTSAAFGIQNGSVPSPPTLFNDVWITGCTTAFHALTTTQIEIRTMFIDTATTGLDLGANSGADRSIFTGIIFKSCTTGVKLVTNALDDSEISGCVFRDCTTGIDLSNLSIVGLSTGSNGSLITNNIFYTTTASNIGIKANGGSAAFRNGLIALNNFRGYTAGNEISGTGSLGTGTQIFHNTTDSGTPLTDFGSPVGHAGSGTGGAAPNSASFVTMAAESSLTSERVLTAGNGVGFTDGGANSTVTLNLANLTGNWTQAGVFDISTAGNLTVLKHVALGAGASIDANSIAVVQESFTDPAATTNAIKGTLTIPMTAGNAQQINALNYAVATSGAFTQSGIISAVRTTFQPVSNSTIADARNFHALAAPGNTTTITSRYGLYVANGSGAGAITNQYGVYIESMTKGGTLNYGLYQAGGQNFLGGEIIAGPVTAPATPAATNLVVYNESGTQFLKTKDASGNVYNMTHKHVFAGVVDGSTASTTVPFALVGPIPHAGTITDVRALPAENKTGGATSGIFDVHLIPAANLNTDGQGTTIFTTQANRPTISSGNKLSTTTAPDVTAVGAGDYLALYTDQVGTNLTFVSVSTTVRYT